MKLIDKDKQTKRNERILSLIEELNSAFDLYYEDDIKKGCSCRQLNLNK